MEPDGRDGSRESDPMLGPRQSGDSDTDAGDRPSRPGNRLQASQPARRAGFFVFLLLCAASALLLAGFVSFQFTQHQQVSKPSVDEGATTGDHGQEAVSLSSSEVAAATPAVPTTASPPTSTLAVTSTTPTASPAVHAPDAGVAPAGQFELGKAFVVTDKPMLREYVFNITRGTGAPDGLEKSMILVNGQSPGPLIEANTGDTIRVLVNNMMTSESTTIHWHGIDQRGSSWMDGVHGVTQCGIPPGESFTYEFNLTDQRGSFWYHSHVSVQYADGLYGPLIVHDPTEQVPVVDDDKIIMVGDLFHQPAEQLLTEYLSKSPPWSSGMPGMEPPPANLLFNGRHTLDCAAAATSGSCTGGSRFSTRVKSGHRVRMRLISHSSSTPFLFTIDNHTLEIVEVDGVEIDPIATTRVYLNPGQRYSVLVNATQQVGNYRMRATAARNCFHLPHSETFLAGLTAIDFQVTGTLSYDDTAIASEPLGEPWNLRSLFNVGFGDEPWKSVCQDLPFDLAKPRRGRDAYSVGPKNLHHFKYRMRTDEGTWRTFINDTKYAPLKDDAALWKVLQLDPSTQHSETDLSAFDFGPGQHVLVSPDPTAGAQIVINSEHMMGHPWHMHGQTFQIVGWGKGAFGPNTHWNLENPLRRDTVTVPGSSHVVIRLLADNPGVWALHCHIQWHAEGGMFLSVANRMEELRAMLQTLEGPGGASKGVMRKFCSTGSA